ncbi:MAG: hypothetical protein KDA47_08085 [Planctomycetales bacterium]|nr:hypothetical protein [Planctomycetales bacterium]
MFDYLKWLSWTLFTVSLASSFGCRDATTTEAVSPPLADEMSSEPSRSGDDLAEPRVVTPEQAFQQLRVNSVKAIREHKLPRFQIADQHHRKDGSAPVESLGAGVIAPCDRVAVDQPPPKLAVKLWGRLAKQQTNGDWRPDEYVNLAQYRWLPQESFYLCVEPAVPVQLAIFQKVSEGQSKTVSPDVNHPKSFATLIPGKVWQSDRLHFDDDPLDELITFVFVRSDLGVLPINGADASPHPVISVETTTTVFLNGVPVAVASSRARQTPQSSEERAESWQTGSFGEPNRSETTKATSMPPNALTETLGILSAIPSYSSTKGIPEVQDTMTMNLEVVHEQPKGVSASEVSLLTLGQNGVGQVQIHFKKRNKDM